METPHWIVRSRYGSRLQLNDVDPMTKGCCQLSALIWALTVNVRKRRAFYAAEDENCSLQLFP